MEETSVSRVLYRVRKTWYNAASQVGAYTNLENAKRACDKAGSGYYVFDENGKVVYHTTAFQSYRVKVMVDALNLEAVLAQNIKLTVVLKTMVFIQLLRKTRLATGEG